MANDNEFFDLEKLSAKSQKFSELMEAFNSKLVETREYFDDQFCKSFGESALYGSFGSSLKETYDEHVDGISNEMNNFEMIHQFMITIMSNDKKLLDETAETYKAEKKASYNVVDKPSVRSEEYYESDSYSDSHSPSMSYGTNEVSTNQPSSNNSSNSTYSSTGIIPSDGVYDGHTIVIPEHPHTEDSRVYRDLGNIIINSAKETNQTIGNENLIIKNFTDNLAYNNTYSNLSENDRNAVMNYLTQQYQARTTLYNQIDKDISNSLWKSDGAVGELTSATIQGDVQQAYQNAVNAASAWIDPLNNLATNEEIAAKMAEYGLVYEYK